MSRVCWNTPCAAGPPMGCPAPGRGQVSKRPSWTRSDAVGTDCQKLWICPQIGCLNNRGIIRCFYGDLNGVHGFIKFGSGEVDRTALKSVIKWIYCGIRYSVMTPCRTEKVDFSKKLKKQKHKQKQNHQKNKSTGRITRRNKKKTKKKSKKIKKNQNCGKCRFWFFFIFFVFFFCFFLVFSLVLVF